jgi:hypothetical protein
MVRIVQFIISVLQSRNGNSGGLVLPWSQCACLQEV